MIDRSSSYATATLILHPLFVTFEKIYNLIIDLLLTADAKYNLTRGSRRTVTQSFSQDREDIFLVFLVVMYKEKKKLDTKQSVVHPHYGVQKNKV